MYIYRVPDIVNPVINPRQVNFPLNEEFVTLGSGQYTVAVVAFNAQGNQSSELSESVEVTVGEGTGESGLDYPFVYIIVPGIVFVVIIIVINVIIFKKVHETRRRSVTYCKGEFVNKLSKCYVHVQVYMYIHTSSHITHMYMYMCVI